MALVVVILLILPMITTFTTQSQMPFCGVSWLINLQNLCCGFVLRRWHGVVGTLHKRITAFTQCVWSLLQQMGYLFECKENKESLFWQTFSYSMQNTSRRKRNRVGGWVDVSRCLSQKWKNFWLLCLWTSKEILQMQQFDLQNWWPFWRPCHAETDRNSLCPSPDICGWNCTCCKSGWKTSAKSCLQLPVPQNIFISVVWKCNCTPAFS